MLHLEPFVEVCERRRRPRLHRRGLTCASLQVVCQGSMAESIIVYIHNILVRFMYGTEPMFRTLPLDPKQFGKIRDFETFDIDDGQAKDTARVPYCRSNTSESIHRYDYSILRSCYFSDYPILWFEATIIIIACLWKNL